MKKTMLVLALAAVVAGSAACAKYPVVTGAGHSAPAPTASVPAPSR
jgi:hypothetical protein